MKVICRVSILLSTLVSTVVHATPAIVWKSSSSRDHDCLYHSQETSARDFLSSVVTANDDKDENRSVLFVLDKHPEGKDAVEEMALQLSSLDSSSLHEIHQHVMGMDTLKNVQKHVKSSGQQSSIVAVSSSLEDLRHKLQVATNAKIHLVELSHENTDANDLKNAIVTALEHVNQVVLTGIRGSDEVKTSRSNNKNKQYRRRLEQDEQEENAYGDDENADLTGVYYVHMTPNIFAGILFILFFSFISILGISCLGMITNVDVYVSKTPPVGREA